MIKLVWRQNFDLDAPWKFTLLCNIGSFSLNFLEYDAIYFSFIYDDNFRWLFCLCVN